MRRVKDQGSTDQANSQPAPHFTGPLSSSPRRILSWLILFLAIAIAALPCGATSGNRGAKEGSSRADDLAVLQARMLIPKPMVWVFTGDSITEGAKWTGFRRSYPEIFSEHIRWELKRNRDLIINTAISGDKTSDILSDFDWRISRLHPDVVSLMIGMNDSTTGQAGEHEFAANLRNLVARIRSVGAIPILQTTNWTQDDPLRRDLPAYNGIIRRVAASEKVVLIDNWLYWNQHRTPANLSEWLGNPIHPNGQGHAELAKQMFRTLDLCKEASPMCQMGNPQPSR